MAKIYKNEDIRTESMASVNEAVGCVGGFLPKRRCIYMAKSLILDNYSN